MRAEIFAKSPLRRVLPGFVLSGVVLSGVAITAVPSAAQETAQKPLLEAKTHASALKGIELRNEGKLPFRWFRPEGADDPGARFPLVLFLHGAGERGTDNAAQLVHGVDDFVAPENQAKRPAFVLAPQCPKGVWWMDGGVYPMVAELTRKVLSEAPIDPNRVYVTGLSMGGYGTFHALAQDPDLFAAAIPICGGGRPESAVKFGGTPIWVFHGKADRVVKPIQSANMVTALEKLGHKPKFTLYDGVGHNSWSRTYADPKVHEWLFAQRQLKKALSPLRDGDRIVFFGDSITAAGARGKGYIRLMESSLAEQRPKLRIELIGAGIGGHKVPNLQKRVSEHVLVRRPSIVMIYIGINDVWHSTRDRGTPKPAFDAGLRDLIEQIRRVGSRVVLCTPSVIGEKHDGTNPLDAMLDEYAAISRKVATDTGCQLLDLRALFLAHLAKNNPKNLDRGILTSDSVHLNAAGNRFVADQMLRALGVDPTPR